MVLVCTYMALTNKGIDSVQRSFVKPSIAGEIDLLQNELELERLNNDCNNMEFSL